MTYIHHFGKTDVFFNTLVARPSYEVVLYSGSAYINNRRNEGINITTGTVNLYELNVDRDGTNESLIYPFLTRDGSYRRPATVTQAEFLSASYGTTLTGSYPLTAALAREYIEASSSALSSYDNAVERRRLHSLITTLDSNRIFTNHYDYETYYLTGDTNLISIPSIIIGSGVQRGTVELNFYFTGTLIDRATDSRQNGELVSTMNSASGSVVGTVLYDEGFILLTSSVDITTGINQDTFIGTATTVNPAWRYFGAYSDLAVSGNSGNYASASLFRINFKGSNHIPTMTMFSTAQAGELNNSLNPTWISSSAAWQLNSSWSSGSFIEMTGAHIANTVQSQYCDYEDQFKKQVFISSIGLLDRDRKLVAIAKVANPVLKKEEDQMTFKLRVDF
jgi:hypothetical protein|tara:strand:+ start:2478 stop:3653 length:1176 start_codon:yes stop_codon:yes gene_type:complete